MLLTSVNLFLFVLDYSLEGYRHSRLAWSSGGVTTWLRKVWEPQFTHKAEGDIFKYLVTTRTKHSLPRSINQ